MIDKIERETALWAKIRAHYEERLLTLRMQNDGDKSQDETAKIRGRIAEVRLLLNMDKDFPATETYPE